MARGICRERARAISTDELKRHIHTHRHTDTPTHRHTDTQKDRGRTDRQTGTYTGTGTGTDIQTHTHGERDRERGPQRERDGGGDFCGFLSATVILFGLEEARIGHSITEHHGTPPRNGPISNDSGAVKSGSC